MTVKPAMMSRRRQRLVIAGAMALTALVLLALYGWAGAMRSRFLLAEQRAAASTVAAPHASSLGNAINERLAMVRGLVAFVATDADDGDFERKFAAYATTLRRSVPGIRNIGVAPDFVVRHINPVEGNEKTIGHNFLTDPRPGFVDLVRQAIDTQNIVTHGPLPLIQGGEGLIARHAIYIGERLWGAVGIVFDLQPILDKANIASLAPRYRFAIRKDSGQMVTGDPRVFDEAPTVETIRLPDGVWELGVVPSRGWSKSGTEDGPGGAFPALFLAAALLIEGLVFLALDRRFNLVREIHDRAVNERRLRQARDAAVSASDAKSRFLAAASHDLRQPVHALRLLLMALEDTIEGDAASADLEAHDLIAEMEAAVVGVSDLLNALLDIARLDAGVIVPDVRDCRVSDLMGQVRQRSQRIARANDVRLTVVPSSLVVRTDPILFHRILDNLIANAIKFSPGGSVLVGCRRRTGRVEIQVVDTGVGIPADLCDTIFEEFRQLGNDARLKSQGLGLGLAIVRRVAGLLDHPVRVRSIPGRGSVFSVTVPLHGQHGSSASTPSKRAPQAPSSILS